MTDLQELHRRALGALNFYRPVEQWVVQHPEQQTATFQEAERRMDALDAHLLGGAAEDVPELIEGARTALSAWRPSLAAHPEQREKIDHAISLLDQARGDTFPAEWTAADRP